MNMLFRDKNGAALALFHAHKHDPTFVTHRTTLQVSFGIWFKHFFT